MSEERRTRSGHLRQLCAVKCRRCEMGHFSHQSARVRGVPKAQHSVGGASCAVSAIRMPPIGRTHTVLSCPLTTPKRKYPVFAWLPHINHGQPPIGYCSRLRAIRGPNSESGSGTAAVRRAQVRRAPTDKAAPHLEYPVHQAARRAAEHQAHPAAQPQVARPVVALAARAEANNRDPSGVVARLCVTTPRSRDGALAISTRNRSWITK